MSISNLTPNQVHQSTKKLKLNKLWKNYYMKNGYFVKQE